MQGAVNGHIAHGFVLLINQIHLLIVVSQLLLGYADHPFNKVQHFDDVVTAMPALAGHAIKIQYRIGALAAALDLLGGKLCCHQQGKDTTLEVVFALWA
ncbi:hypothetical protein HX099_04485 [Thiopseudomonas alkaliphila]|uniref:Secreted protein n=1 Tax=Thiopseudomonas alkaliphila TaxID=1697053 RepID=A0AAW7DQ25_9GAMM|nr:hypothetical protein [Thiopseudomonas alkaliphila]MDM1695924.1 hypothetical protein [Thiopseudomonas alkaliphila]